MKNILTILGLAIATLAGANAADEYWRTDGTSGGTWTSTFWNIGSANATGGTGWTAANDAFFTANSTLTFATSTVGNVTVSNSSNVTITAGGTLSLGAVRTFDIGTGSTLAWTGQTVTANSAAGITKNGGGILNLGETGGFTLNNGTVIVSGAKALGNGALTLNGGTLQSSGTTSFTATSLTIGGDFALAGTGNSNWDAATTIALGASTRTITNNAASGSRQFRGLISGGAGAGIVFVGNNTSTDQLYIGNTGNTFDGPVTINGGEVVFNDNGALGNTTSITLDGGRLTMASMVTSGSTSALTSATIASGKNIFVSAAAGTSISVQGATGVTTYNGVIADKSGTTGAWAKQGGGLLSLGGVSTYTGATAINNGILQLTTGNDRLPTGTVLSLGQAASTNVGTFDLNGHNQQIAGLNSTTGTAITGNNTVTSSAAATLTIGGNGTYSYGSNSANNTGIITGAVSVVKQGSGSQTLGGANTYTGTTTVNDGSLLLSGGGTIGAGNLILGGGTFSIANITGGNYTLSANQSLTGAGSIDATGKELVLNGTLAPGNSPGTISVTGNFTLGAAAVSNFDINGTTAGLFDRLNVTGALTFGGTLNLTTGYSANVGDSVKLFNAGSYAGALSVTGTSLGGGLSWNTGTLNTDGTITVVPEPKTCVLIGIGISFTLWNLRRRRKMEG